MLYYPPSGATNPNASYVGKDVAAGRQGSRVPRGAIEHPQREIVNFIEAAGLIPSSGDLFQLAKAVQSGKVVYAEAAGTNSLTAALDPEPSNKNALPDGMHVLLWCPNANAGALTLSLNGGLASSVLRSGGGQFAKDDIPAGGMYLLLARRGGVWRSVIPLKSELATGLLTTPGSARLLNPDIFLAHAISPTGSAPRALPTMPTNDAQRLAARWRFNTIKNTGLAPIGGCTVNPSTYAVGPLPIGYYDGFFFGYAYSAGSHRSQLWDITNGVELDVGGNSDSFIQGQEGVTTISMGLTSFYVSSPIYVALHHFKTENVSIGSTYGDNNTNTDVLGAVLRLSLKKGIA